MDSESEPTGRIPEQGDDRQGQPASAGHDSDPPAEADEHSEGALVDDEHATGANSALPPKLEAWRRRSAAGAILTGFALGLQEALETRKDEPSIVLETSGDPPKDLPVEAEFEYGRPRQSVVQIRPWLLPDQSDGGSESASAADRAVPDTGPGTSPAAADAHPTTDRPAGDH